MSYNKDKVSEKVQEAFFNQLLDKPGNGECADCNTKSPTWLSLDFGVFVCIRCSGIHRQYGQHITRVRSTRLDGLHKEYLEIMAAVGNKLANQYYEHNMSVGYRKPTTNSSSEECKRFMDEKYIRKAWSPSGFTEPVKEVLECRKNGTKPGFAYAKDRQTSEKVQAAPVVHENHRQSNTLLRKKSMSLDKLPSKPEHNHQNVDLMSQDVDLLGGNDGNDFGDFKQAHSASPQKKTINFANFKKAQNDNTQQQQAQPQTQTQWAWDLTAQANPEPQNPTNSGVQGQTEQKPAENKVDLMKLYSQPTQPMHQNHFMHGGMYPQQQQWNGHMQGNFNNNGWNGHMGQQSHFQGGFPNQFGGQQGFNNMAYNQVPMNGTMGYNQVPMNGQFGNGFAQASQNRFF